MSKKSIMKNFYLLYKPYMEITPQIGEQKGNNSITQQVAEQLKNTPITPQVVEQIANDVFSTVAFFAIKSHFPCHLDGFHHKIPTFSRHFITFSLSF